MAGEDVWVKLPSIIIVEILSYLSLADRLNATSACRRWRSCLFHPILWRSIHFKVKNDTRSRSKHLANMCGRFVRNVTVEFNSQISENVKECLRILEMLTDNTNLEKLALRPSSCQVMQVDWFGKETGETTVLFTDSLEAIIKNARCLKHLSVGCLEELGDHAPVLLPLLAEHHRPMLETLHVATVKEDPDSYGLIEMPVSDLHGMSRLRVLGIDYDYISKELLDGFSARTRATPLERLIIHVHGIEHGREKIADDSWRRLVAANPTVEVTLNLIHSMDGATGLLDVLRPSMPLAHLRMFFCQLVNVAAIDFIARHMASRLRSLHVVDAMSNMTPNDYYATWWLHNLSEEDPFVMLAWRCKRLTHFTIIGYEMSDDDMIAIARLRGRQLQTFDVPLSCISSLKSESGVEEHECGCVGTDFNDEISESLGREWHPISNEQLHLAVKDPNADAETAYLNILLQDQAIDGAAGSAK